MNNKIKKIYTDDRLTAKERLNTVIRLEKPDRVPISLMLYHFAPIHANVKMSEYMSRPKVYMEVMRNLWKELGPWDIYYNINPISRLTYSYVMMMRALWPGIELKENEMAQTDEIEYMFSEDYDNILNASPILSDLKYRLEMLPRFCKEAEGKNKFKLIAYLARDLLFQMLFWRIDFNWWQKQGAVVQIGHQAEMPFDTFSQARNVINFSMDLFQRPDKIGMASTKLAINFANCAVMAATLTGVPLVQCYLHRSSNSFISPQQFEKLAFPGLEIIVNRIIDAGMTPILHCDGDWLKNFKIMKRLPPKKIILQLDGLTDIFLAKKEIGDHMCIFGDVPAAKLVTGTSNEVDEYCHRLIEEVGKDGGFILAGGCEIPPNARFENLQVMVNSVRKYGYYNN